MPVYEYECGACGHCFEEWQKINDAPVRTCPKCHKRKVERLISQTSFSLKGGGWYGDLYASKKPGASGGGDKGEGPVKGTASPKEGGSEAKAPSDSPSTSTSEKKGNEKKGKKKDSGSGSRAASAAP